MTVSESERKRGYIYALLAYGVWGFLPIYWKLLHSVASLEILLNRLLWSFIFYSFLVAFKRHKYESKPLSPSVVRRSALAGIILGCNWFVYIYGVNAGFIVETSLGYFINPLITVAFGVVILREKLSKAKWAALSIAAFGVIYLALEGDHFPWIAIFLAMTFSTYGLLRKTTIIETERGAQIETIVMLAPVMIAIVLSQYFGVIPKTEHLFQHPWHIWAMLVGSGIVTGLPILWFVESAKRIPLSMLGFLQFLAPTLQFLVGVLIYNEPFGFRKLIGFGMIWTALAILSADALRKPKRPIAE